MIEEQDGSEDALSSVKSTPGFGPLVVVQHHTEKGFSDLRRWYCECVLYPFALEIVLNAALFQAAYARLLQPADSVFAA